MQVAIVDIDRPIEMGAVCLCGLPEAALTLFSGTPTPPVGERELAAEPTPFGVPPSWSRKGGIGCVVDALPADGAAVPRVAERGRRDGGPR